MAAVLYQYVLYVLNIKNGSSSLVPGIAMSVPESRGSAGREIGVGVGERPGKAKDDDPSFISSHPHFSPLSPFLHSSEFRPPDSPMATSNEAGTDETMQRFRLGAIIRDFELLTSDIPGQKGFVFLEDVQYAFDTEAARFEAGTVVIPFMRGPDRRK